MVKRHHGVINQFLGDGFMSTFGAPVSGGEDCRNALAAARELVERLPMRVGIGLHVGLSSFVGHSAKFAAAQLGGSALGNATLGVRAPGSSVGGAVGGGA